MHGQSARRFGGSNGRGPPPPPYREADHTTSHHPAPAMHPHDQNSEREGLLQGQNVVYGTVGRAPLLATRRKHWSPAPSDKAILLGLAGLFLVLVFLAGYFSNEAMNAKMHDVIRYKWALEENQHAITREAWAVETREHEELQLELHHEIIMLEDKRAKGEMNWNSECAAMAKERREWAHEREEHARRADEERQREEERKREQREEEARQRNGMTWAGLEPKHCLRYGVKEYTATLTHVPLGFNAIAECQKKPIEINGRQWLPSLCEDQGICGRVTAHWEVDTNEAMCTPWWGAFSDKGCVGSGIRRHESRLESIQDPTNWEALCSTTPANINGVHYDGPTSCTGWGWSGVWGIWLVDDDTCR